ncbi:MULTISPECIES: substrate-binding periplasmic protein [Nitrospirillum]|uniref:Amino acid ABC transporter substrate-binding protein (PAAT family) n=1 Tax=Nitrospirillum amazonense TaxID=28077 RepID=A0A560FBE4_9PROT|nr:transporter substrate-binding domain-containing protein [Nitrospirillum amazonense]MEC4593196.1 transporter substrate-binding domain-containing protein [Nitrospirillum amazonense]TWB18937.1 amino acid ABC transporter substrate-binding protein (PAAT family) [Nitrospirillum amazonense]
MPRPTLAGAVLLITAAVAGLAALFSDGAGAQSPAGQSPTGQSPALVFGILETEQPPLVDMRNGEVAGGLIKAIGDEIARRTGLRPLYRLVPRNRLEADLADGLIDLACGYSPDWLPKVAITRFSTPILVSHSVLVVRRGDSERLRTLGDLAGRSIGAILGFRYPREVEAAFIDGTWQREDAPSAESNFLKLRNRRVDAILTTDLEADYRQTTDKTWAQALTVLPQTVGDHEERCANAPRSPLPMETLDAAIEAMRADGTLTRLRLAATGRAAS